MRAALSADVDGEGGPLSRDAESHLDRCDECIRWRNAAHQVTRTARLSAAMPAADLAARLVAGVTEAARQRRVRRYWLAFFAGVVVVGVVQIAATVPLLLLARRAVDGHPAGRVLGLAEAVIGAAFFVGGMVVLWRMRDSSTLHVVEVDRAAEPDRARAVDGRVA